MPTALPGVVDGRSGRATYDELLDEGFDDLDEAVHLALRRIRPLAAARRLEEDHVG